MSDDDFQGFRCVCGQEVAVVHLECRDEWERRKKLRRKRGLEAADE